MRTKLGKKQCIDYSNTIGPREYSLLNFIISYLSLCLIHLNNSKSTMQIKDITLVSLFTAEIIAFIIILSLI